MTNLIFSYVKLLDAFNPRLWGFCMKWLFERAMSTAICYIKIEIETRWAKKVKTPLYSANVSSTCLRVNPTNQMWKQKPAQSVQWWWGEIPWDKYGIQRFQAIEILTRKNVQSRNWRNSSDRSSWFQPGVIDCWCTRTLLPTNFELMLVILGFAEWSRWHSITEH